jgi:hypothetical protein
MKNIIKFGTLITIGVSSAFATTVSDDKLVNNNQVNLIIQGINQDKVDDYVIKEELMINYINDYILENPIKIISGKIFISDIALAYPEIEWVDINGNPLDLTLDIDNKLIIFNNFFKDTNIKNDLNFLHKNTLREKGFIDNETNNYIVPLEEKTSNFLFMITNINSNGILSKIELSDSEKSDGKFWYKPDNNGNLEILVWNNTDLEWKTIINIDTSAKTLYLNGRYGIDINNIIGKNGQKLIVSLTGGTIKEYKYYENNWIEVYATVSSNESFEDTDNVYVTKSSLNIIDATFKDILDLDKLYYNETVGTEIYINLKDMQFLFENRIREESKYEPNGNEFVKFIKQPNFWIGDKTYTYDSSLEKYDLKIIITDNINNLPDYMDNYIYLLKGDEKPYGVKIDGVLYNSQFDFSNLTIDKDSKYFIRSQGIILEGNQKLGSNNPYLTDSKTFAITNGDLVDLPTFDKKENILYLSKIGSGSKSELVGLENYYAKAKNKETGIFQDIITCNDISETSNCIAFQDNPLLEAYTTIYNPEIGLAWRLPPEYVSPYNVSWVNSYYNGKDRWITYNKFNPDTIYYPNEDEKYRYQNLFDETDKINTFLSEKNDYELNNIYKIRPNNASKKTYYGGELNLKDEFFTYYSWDSDAGGVVGRVTPLKFYYYKDVRPAYSTLEGSCCGCWYNCSSCTDCATVYYPDNFMNGYVQVAGYPRPTSTSLRYPTVYYSYIHFQIEETKTEKYVLNPYDFNYNKMIIKTMPEIASNQRVDEDEYTFVLDTTSRTQKAYYTTLREPIVYHTIYDYTPEKLIENCKLKTTGREDCKYQGMPFDGINYGEWKNF